MVWDYRIPWKYTLGSRRKATGFPSFGKLMETNPMGTLRDMDRIEKVNSQTDTVLDDPITGAYPVIRHFHLSDFQSVRVNQWALLTWT